MRPRRCETMSAWESQSEPPSAWGLAGGSQRESQREQEWARESSADKHLVHSSSRLSHNEREICLQTATMHYRLRSIEKGYYWFLNFASHFICFQIFQIDFSAENLILSASKYSRYNFWGRNAQFFIGTRQEKGRVECLWEFQIFFPEIIAQIFEEKNICFSKVQFHHEGTLSESRYFELFFSTRYETPPHKNQLLLRPPSSVT